MLLKTLQISCIKYFQIKKTSRFKTPRKLNFTLNIAGISFIDYLRYKLPFVQKDEDKIEKYWQHLPLEQVLKEADQSFEEQRYLEVYESLNKIKYSNDIEVIWRLARVLFNLSLTSVVENDVRKQMIQEAYEILEKSKTAGINQANYHKWMAVITNRKNGLESLEVKIKGYPKVRDQLTLACKCNPRDFTVQYMLGRWHYDMAHLTWLQRMIAKYLFQEPPKSTYQEAYRHLCKAEELNPRCFLPNIYLLGCVCFKLGQYYRARYYLNMALGLPAHSKCEACCVTKAKKILEQLEKYDLGLDLLLENLENFSFVNGFEH